jgi:hypothetical protein
MIRSSVSTMMTAAVGDELEAVGDGFGADTGAPGAGTSAPGARGATTAITASRYRAIRSHR